MPMLCWSWRSPSIHPARWNGSFRDPLQRALWRPSISTINNVDGKRPLWTEGGTVGRFSSPARLPVPQPRNEQERGGLVRIGQIVARGARQTLDQQFLVAFVVRFKRDRGDDHEDSLIDAVETLRSPHLGAPCEGMRECHCRLPRG